MRSPKSTIISSWKTSSSTRSTRLLYSRKRSPLRRTMLCGALYWLVCIRNAICTVIVYLYSMDLLMSMVMMQTYLREERILMMRWDSMTMLLLTSTRPLKSAMREISHISMLGVVRYIVMQVITSRRLMISQNSSTDIQLMHMAIMPEVGARNCLEILMEQCRTMTMV